MDVSLTEEQRAAKQGFVGAILPPPYGGAGIDTVTASLVAEEFNRVDAGLAGAIGATDLGTEAIHKLIIARALLGRIR